MNTSNNNSIGTDTTGLDMSQQNDINRDNNISNLQEPNGTNSTDKHLIPEASNDATVLDNSRIGLPSHEPARQDTTERDPSRQDATGPVDETETYTSEPAQAGLNASTLDNNGTGPDTSEQNSLEQSSWIEIQQTIEELERQGIKRTVRSVQRYCNRGKLTCKLVPTENAVRYLIDKSSIAAFVKRHNESMPSQGFGTQSEDRERSSNIGADHQSEMDKTHLAQSNQQSELILSLKDQQIEMLTSQLAVTNKQLDMKDEQISAMLERDHETNVLINNLQNMFALPSAGQTASISKASIPKNSMSDNGDLSTSDQSRGIQQR